MTTQESFKKRIRARMQATGEKYNAARRAMIEQADRRDARTAGRRWVSDPEHSDAAVQEATGRGWDEWVDLIEDAPVVDDGHTAVARWLEEEHQVDGWWAQSVTGGWERITGRRLPHQMPDGTFTASRSRTMDVDAATVRGLLLDEGGRALLFPGHETQLRSRPTSRSLRVAFPVGVALFSFDARDDGRVTVTVSHEKLEDSRDVGLWKQFWGDWLEALEG